MTIQAQDTKALSRSFAASNEVPKRKAKPKRPSPVTLRLTPDERAKLEELATGMTLSAYIFTATICSGSNLGSWVRTLVVLEAALGFGPD